MCPVVSGVLRRGRACAAATRSETVVSMGIAASKRLSGRAWCGCRGAQEGLKVAGAPGQATSSSRSPQASKMSSTNSAMERSVPEHTL